MIRHESGLWFLEAGGSQAVLGLYGGRWPVLYHWGSPISGGDLARIPAAANGHSVFGDDKTYTPNRLPLEYPGPDAGDFRSPAFGARTASGVPAIELVCTAWRTDTGRDLGGLPGARLPEHTPTLVLTLTDTVTGLEAELRYTPLDQVLLRSVRFTNRGAEPLILERAFSFSFDLYPDRELDIVALDGAWARERQLRRFDLPAGRWETGSRRGVSSHQAWPGVVLAEKGAREDGGQVWGAALVWSGDWTMGAETDEDGGWRVQGGLHPETFRRTLAPGASFVTPEAVLVYSADGLSGLSAAYHTFVIDRLLPPAWARRPRPVVANNWEATYFAFTEENLLALADEAASLGVELFVLDDGWFGRRDDDRSSLGDWTPHPGKFRHGLTEFAREIEKRGLGFGLWIEPEMISADSDLYRAHPDWCLHLEGRPRLEGRHQLVLDLSRGEVREYLLTSMTVLLSSVPVSYVKWDMNRPLAHAGAKRFDWVVGLYELMGALTSRFPHVLFEGCCGGGGRMDFGLLYFTPQYWTSDNTDAVARLGIQEGTSLFLPPLVMGAHVSAVPNHQTGRVTTLEARIRVACAGNLGYELDFTKLGDEEKRTLAEATTWYKKHRALLQRGPFHRTRTTLEDANTVAWQIGTADEMLLFWYRPTAVANTRLPTYRWRGLDVDAIYEVRLGFKGKPTAISGSELVHRGLPLPVGDGDAAGAVVHVKRATLRQ